MTSIEISLAGRTFVVARAGGGGIGTAVAHTLRAAGARVVGLDIDPERLAMADVDVGRIVDARDHSAVDATLRDVGPVDGLVYVAGGLRVDQWAPTERLALESFDDVLALNLRAALSTSQVVAAQLMVAAKPGSIVYI